MHPRQQHQRARRADQAHQHVPLRVPHIALRAQKRFRPLPHRLRRSELIEALNQIQALGV